MRFFIRLSVCSAAVFGLLAFDARAQELSTIEETVTSQVETCVVNSIGRNLETDDCVGVIFKACDGFDRSTYSMVNCFGQETDYWKSMMTQTFSELSESYRATERQTIAGEPLVDSLAKSQEAWQMFLEAQCRFEYDEVGMGSMRMTRSAICKRDLTAKRAIFLRGLNANQ